MSAIDEALKRPAGARFWRAALQVNPFSYASAYRGSRNQSDEQRYNNELVEACRRNNVEVVGLADHNSVDDLERLRSTLQNAGIRVFPGFEIATVKKAHIVCLFPSDTSVADLNKHLGALGVPNPGDTARPSTFSYEQLAKLVVERSGISYAAHCDGKSGVLRLSGDGGGLPHIWTNEDLLLAAQITRPIAELSPGVQTILRNKDPHYKRRRQACAHQRQGCRDARRPR